MTLAGPPEQQEQHRPLEPVDRSREPCGPEWVVERITDNGYAIWINRSTDPPTRRCVPVYQP